MPLSGVGARRLTSAFPSGGKNLEPLVDPAARSSRTLLAPREVRQRRRDGARGAVPDRGRGRRRHASSGRVVQPERARRPAPDPARPPLATRPRRRASPRLRAEASARSGTGSRSTACVRLLDLHEDVLWVVDLRDAARGSSTTRAAARMVAFTRARRWRRDRPRLHHPASGRQVQLRGAASGGSGGLREEAAAHGRERRRRGRRQADRAPRWRPPRDPDPGWTPDPDDRPPLTRPARRLSPARGSFRFGTTLRAYDIGSVRWRWTRPGSRATRLLQGASPATRRLHRRRDRARRPPAARGDRLPPASDVARAREPVAVPRCSRDARRSLLRVRRCKQPLSGSRRVRTLRQAAALANSRGLPRRSPPSPARRIARRAIKGHGKPLITTARRAGSGLARNSC